MGLVGMQLQIRGVESFAAVLTTYGMVTRLWDVEMLEGRYVRAAGGDRAAWVMINSKIFVSADDFRAQDSMG